MMQAKYRDDKIRSPENRNQRIAPRQSRSDSARLFRGAIHFPVLQLQRTLGNQRVARMIQGKCLTPQGEIIGLQRKLAAGAAVDRYEQAADAVTILASQCVRSSVGNPAVGLQRQSAQRGIGRQEIEKCVRKWEKEPEEMSIHAAEHFAGTEIDPAPSLRFATVRCINDHDCKITVKRGGPVFDVSWNKELRRIGVGFNYGSGRRRFCAYDYDGCDQYNRRTPNGVLTLTLVGCHGPRP